MSTEKVTSRQIRQIINDDIFTNDSKKYTDSNLKKVEVSQKLSSSSKKESKNNSLNSESKIQSSLQDEIQYLVAEKNMAIIKLKKINSNQDFLNISKNIHYLNIVINHKNDILQKLPKGDQSSDRNSLNADSKSDASLRIHNWKIPLAPSIDSKKNKTQTIYSFIIVHCDDTIVSSNLIEGDNSQYELSTNELFVINNLRKESVLNVELFYTFSTNQELAKTVSKSKVEFQPYKFKHFGSFSVKIQELLRDDCNIFKFRKGDTIINGGTVTSINDDILNYIIPYFQFYALVLPQSISELKAPEIFEIRLKASDKGSWQDRICYYFGDYLHIHANNHVYELRDEPDISISLSDSSLSKILTAKLKTYFDFSYKNVKYSIMIDDQAKFETFDQTYKSTINLLKKFPQKLVSGGIQNKNKKFKAINNEDFYKQIPAIKFFQTV